VEVRLTIAQAVVVILALLWDLSLSGQSITNVRTRLLPRHSNVMLYLGYLLLLATEILYWSSLRSIAPIPNSFDSDRWPAIGLLYLGIPYVAWWFVTRLVRRSALALPESPREPPQVTAVPSKAARSADGPPA